MRLFGWSLIFFLCDSENGYWVMSKWDHKEWIGLVRYAMEKGDNEGVPIPGVLDEVAMNIERLHLPSYVSSFTLI